MDSLPNVAELSEVRETIQQLLKWGWKYNRNLEEQAAQLHMLAGWAQIVEVDWFLKKFKSAFVFMTVCHPFKISSIYLLCCDLYVFVLGVCLQKNIFS